jgi:small subunit ribosomal protein S2
LTASRPPDILFRPIPVPAPPDPERVAVPSGPPSDSKQIRMSELSVEALIEAGAHIGCRVSRWNPKMGPYIFESRNRIHVIDLRETIKGILRAKFFLREIVAGGADVLFVGTKQQLRAEVTRAHTETGMHYVDDRWIGGTLTNYEVIGSRIHYLDDMEKKEREGWLSNLNKKEGSRFTREKRKVFRNLHGIREMFRLPGALVVMDPRTEINAVREARRMGIPVIAVVDTDGDPDLCDVVIPANDDAIRSVALILDHLIEAVNEGKLLRAERGIAAPARQAETVVRREPGAPVPRPRAQRRSLPRPGIRGVNRQVEMQAIPEQGGGGGDAPTQPEGSGDAPAPDQN